MIVIILCISCNKESPPLPLQTEISYTEDDLIELTDSLKTIYYNDAAFIEYLDFTKDSTAAEYQVRLREENIESYFNDLILIYNSSYKLGNTFFEYFMGIHNNDIFTLYNMYAAVDTNKSWIENIKNRKNFSGIAEIDSLLTLYTLSIRYVGKDSYHYLDVSSTEPLNTRALSNKFISTGEFIYFEPNGLIGLNTSIVYKEEANVKKYIFYLGWGDCLSGCIHRHYWDIIINDKNEVKLNKEYGDSLS